MRLYLMEQALVGRSENGRRSTQPPEGEGDQRSEKVILDIRLSMGAARPVRASQVDRVERAQPVLSSGLCDHKCIGVGKNHVSGRSLPRGGWPGTQTSDLPDRVQVCCVFTDI